MPCKTKKKTKKLNPWHYHHANNKSAANRIAIQLLKLGKDVRVRKASKGSGFTVWERN